MKRAWLAGLVALTLAGPAAAHRDKDDDDSGEGVGLGVAVGGSYSPTQVEDGDVAGGSFAWGFFVDIPLLATFYISPAAMLYELNLPNGKEPVTDIDLNFKFIVPIGPVKLGVGLTGGLTNAERRYNGHYGGLAFFSYNLVANFEIFVLAQYKRLERDGTAIDNIHAFGGGMFYF